MIGVEVGDEGVVEGGDAETLDVARDPGAGGA